VTPLGAETVATLLKWLTNASVEDACIQAAVEPDALRDLLIIGGNANADEWHATFARQVYAARNKRRAILRLAIQKGITDKGSDWRAAQSILDAEFPRGVDTALPRPRRTSTLAVHARLGAQGNDRLTLAQLVRLDPNALTRPDRVFQAEQREVMVRKWAAWGLPDDQVVRLAVAHFGIEPAAGRRMLRKVRLDLVNEARAVEAVPMEERRHADRVRVQHLFDLAREKNNLSVAARCAELLIRLNGTMPVREEIPVTPVPEAHQAARRLPIEELRSIVAQQRARMAAVPRAEEEAPEYAEYEDEPAGADEDGDVDDDEEDGE
jgi:hypothetical protein